MDWIQFDVIEVARLCGLTIHSHSCHQTEVKALCPFCGDIKYHLSLNTETNQWYCFRCGARGNAVSLYAQTHMLSNRDALHELKKYSLSIPGDTSRGAISKQDIRSLRDRHNVYYDLLSMLGLRAKHRYNLINRGLTEADIRRFMYRSIPYDLNERRKIIYTLAKRYDLSGIPGFYIRNGEWDMYVPKYDGFFIPVCDCEGYIQGLQMRLDSDDTRYRWFSTANFPNGTGVRAWTHTVGNTSATEAFLTEGALKSDIASALSGGALYIAVPGVNAIGYLPETLERLNIKKVYEVFDMDKHTNTNVRIALLKIKTLLYDRGIEVQSCNWNPRYKGIDDYRLHKQRYYAQTAA